MLGTRNSMKAVVRVCSLICTSLKHCVYWLNVLVSSQTLYMCIKCIEISGVTARRISGCVSTVVWADYCGAPAKLCWQSRCCSHIAARPGAWLHSAYQHIHFLLWPNLRDILHSFNFIIEYGISLILIFYFPYSTCIKPGWLCKWRLCRQYI